ncbi:hypothetical protein LUR56_38845 [Streptomyces sp. MT29]|nr:hypothetical protein [Streptomyces sp. MT29]
MNTPRTKILAAAAAVALLAGGGALALSLRGGDEPAPQTSFCWGSLTREDVSALTVEPRERYTSRETAVTTSRLSYCDVDDEFTLSLESLHSAESVWGTADEVAAALPGPRPDPRRARVGQQDVRRGPAAHRLRRRLGKARALSSDPGDERPGGHLAGRRSAEADGHRPHHRRRPADRDTGLLQACPRDSAGDRPCPYSNARSWTPPGRAASRGSPR